jgi:hypothetical protein
MPKRLDADDFPPTPPPTLSEATRIALTAPQLWAVAIAIIVGTFFATMAWFNVGQRLDILSAKFDATTNSRWTADDQREWVHRLRSDNGSTLKLPDPDVVRRDLRDK